MEEFLSSMTSQNVKNIYTEWWRYPLAILSRSPQYRVECHYKNLFSVRKSVTIIIIYFYEATCSLLTQIPISITSKEIHLLFQHPICLSSKWHFEYSHRCESNTTWVAHPHGPYHWGGVEHQQNKCSVPICIFFFNLMAIKSNIEGVRKVDNTKADGRGSIQQNHRSTLVCCVGANERTSIAFMINGWIFCSLRSRHGPVLLSDSVTVYCDIVYHFSVVFNEQHVMWAQINMFRKQLYSDFNKKIALIHRKSLSHADRHRHTPYYWIGYIIHPKPISLHTNLLSGYYFAFVFFPLLFLMSS